ncbi:ATP-binding cassette domain-containing protein [Streptomyces sp. C10-9-1]|uniref:ABC transporter ATP-binding protein/permease n=1 Tax=Streptomyces sp. C10-9-1 TaxID=1859285 RepID=UPI00211257E6|nr:ATP-binding cassette domain-containing protein [Streptomyces sp. C10-9-1]MCQ6552242.1 ATP-binding cassette domain-containing protein [Streptomyces sp. C10-9-1]
MTLTTTGTGRTAHAAPRARRRPVAAIVFAALVALAVVGPWIAPGDPRTGAGMPYAPVSWEHPLGTDYLGADVLARVLAGGRALVLVSLSVLVAAYALGLAAGMFAAFRGGRAGTVVMRLADVMMGLPPLVLIAVVVTGTGPGLVGVAVAVVAVMLPDVTRIVRAATQQVLAHDYVEVAVARGERTRSVLVREVLPNLTVTLAADAGVRFVGAAYAVATAGFLGLGVQPPDPDWGLMILENRGGLALQPLAVLAPSLMLLVLLLAAGRVADGVRPGAAAGPRRRSRPPRAGRLPVAAAPGPDGGRGPAAAVTGLSLTAVATGQDVVRGVDLTIPRGAVVALVGPSGSGKTSTALALLGHVGPGMARTAGAGTLLGTDPAVLTPRGLRALRARSAAYVAQDARTSLPANLRLRALLDEQLRAAGVPRRERAERARLALSRVGLPTDPAFLARRPHRLSGGQRQRLSVAAALAREPELLVLDEPTSALDAENTRRLLAEVTGLCRGTGTAVLLISHDLESVAAVADTVVTMGEGRVVRSGPPAEVLAVTADEPAAAEGAPDPAGRPDAATAAGPAPRESTAAGPAPRESSAAGPVLRVSGMGVSLPGTGRVLDDVSLELASGGRLCVMGPSGSGKTTLLRAVAGLAAPDSGTVRLTGDRLAARVAGRTPAQLRRMQLVPQNPYDSLNPRQSVGRIVGRPLHQFGLVKREQAEAEVRDLLVRVGLSPDQAASRPSELSGGERQRVAIARALAARPDVLLCDEITSALDRSTSLTVLALLDELSRGLGLALLVVTHDPAVPDRLGGRVVEVTGGRLRPRVADSSSANA